MRRTVLFATALVGFVILYWRTGHRRGKKGSHPTIAGVYYSKMITEEMCRGKCLEEGLYFGRRPIVLPC